MAICKTTSRCTKPPTDFELDALWKQFEECQPMMTIEELEETSRMLFGAGGRRTVRAGLLMLTKSGRDLLKMMRNDSDMVSAFKDLAECAKDRAERMRGVAEALETAALRLGCALCDVPVEVAP